MTDASVGRVLRGKAHAKGVAAGKLVEITNSLEARDFFDRYFAGSASSELSTLAANLHLAVTLRDADTLGQFNLHSCLTLVEETSKADYANSEVKWKPAAKKTEMLLPDMKYIIISSKMDEQKSHDKASNVQGFCSFMVTYEDGNEVIYIYEIHLCSELQDKKLGRALMMAIEEIGREVKVAKVMLTVFRSNTRACRWYDKLGYSVDEFSPGPKRLRNGIVKEPTYLILSKSLNGT